MGRPEVSRWWHVSGPLLIAFIFCTCHAFTTAISTPACPLWLAIVLLITEAACTCYLFNLNIFRTCRRRALGFDTADPPKLWVTGPNSSQDAPEQIGHGTLDAPAVSPTSSGSALSI